MQSQIPIIKSNLLFKFFICLKRSDMKPTRMCKVELFFLQWIVIECRHFSYGGRVLPKKLQAITLIETCTQVVTRGFYSNFCKFYFW
jgi:hypothetical protein